jgi:hypothetical protein
MFSEHDIDRELKAALSVTPSADFEARVRQRIDERRARAWRWTSAWTWAAAAAGLAVVVSGAVLMNRSAVAPPVPVPGRTIAGSTPSTAPAPPPTTTAPAGRHPEVRHGGVPHDAVRHTAATANRESKEPEVLVPPQQAEAIRRLARMVAQGRVEMPDEPLASVAGVPVELAVNPLVVAPIPETATEAGGGNKPPMRGF